MTEQAPEQDAVDWSDTETEGPGFAGQTYPEYPYSLADHVYTWSPKLPDGSMLVIRANTAEGLAQASEAVAAVTGRLRAAWSQVAGGPAPAPQAPAQQPWNQQPAQPVPNQPYPGQPAWQTAGAPPQAPAQGGWGGQQQRKEYPAPQGWYRLNGARKEQVDAVASANGIPKGRPDKGGMYNFWGLAPNGQPGKAWYCAPQVAGAFAQFNPVPA